MYELEKALELMKAGEEILQLGGKIKGVNTLREFDIITKNKLIECKNWDWFSKTEKDIADALNKLCQQNQLALEKGKIFEMHSRQSIPANIKTWLHKKGIIFVEDML